MEAEEMLGLIAFEIAVVTAQVEAATESLMPDALPCARDLARKLGLRLETVKKKLRLLKAGELIHPVSVSPKRYRFNHYALRELPPESDFYRLFCETESPYFIGKTCHSGEDRKPFPV